MLYSHWSHPSRIHPSGLLLSLILRLAHLEQIHYTLTNKIPISHAHVLQDTLSDRMLQANGASLVSRAYVPLSWYFPIGIAENLGGTLLLPHSVSLARILIST